MGKFYLSKEDYNGNKPIYTQKIYMQDIRQAYKKAGEAINAKHGIKEKIEIDLSFINYYTEEKIDDKKAKYNLKEHNLGHIIARYNRGKITLVNKETGKYISKLSDIEKTILMQDYIIKSIAYQIVQEYGQSRCYITKTINSIYDKVLEIL